MSAISISISNSVIKHEGDLVASGNLIIGEFFESFHASLSYWNRLDYLSQWRSGLERLLAGENRSVIISSMYNPRNANFINWWKMYLLGDTVYIQNQILFLDELTAPFNENDIYSSIPERETETEDGDKISEWQINRNAIGPCYRDVIKQAEN
jgi:hypothetical protein